MTALKIASDADEPDPATPSAEMYDVTPAIAKRWMTRNVRNRKAQPGVVSAYARDMASGHWKVTGEAIKFDTNGALADGQHRLMAVIKSGVTVRMLVVRGVAPESQSVMDSGRKRSAIDALTLAGRGDGPILASAARFALAEPGAGFVTQAEVKKNITNSEIHEFVETYDTEITEAATVARFHYPAIDMPPSVSCVAWMILSQIDKPAAAEFWTSIAESRTDGKGDPRLALIRRLQSMRRNNERVTQSVYLSLFFRAWNTWRAGKTAEQLPTHIGGQPVKIPDRLR
jgi:hypothetical protein